MPRRLPPPTCRRGSTKIPLPTTRRRQGGRPKHRTSPWSRKWVAFRTALRNSPVTPSSVPTLGKVFMLYTWRPGVTESNELEISIIQAWSDNNALSVALYWKLSSVEAVIFSGFTLSNRPDGKSLTTQPFNWPDWLLLLHPYRPPSGEKPAPYTSRERGDSQTTPNYSVHRAYESTDHVNCYLSQPHQSFSDCHARNEGSEFLPDGDTHMPT